MTSRSMLEFTDIRILTVTVIVYLFALRIGLFIVFYYFSVSRLGQKLATTKKIMHINLQ